MMKLANIFLLAVAILLLGVGLGEAQAAPANRYAVAGIENAAEFETAFAELQKAVAANDRSRVADFVLYPLRVNGWWDELKGKGTFMFATKPEFLDNYDDIMTPQVRAAIVQQKVANLFVNWQGVMVGNGEAWLSVSAKDPKRYGLSAINLGIEK
ncbi:MAG: hypothetical protein GYA36_04680 [Veillonellaceae bacterium]|nr:hypothetical protein [Veillonellaceae bacterium]